MPISKQILKSDKDRLEKSREKAKEVEARIIRNIKRRNARLKNKIKPDGHQYLNDSTKATNSSKKVASYIKPKHVKLFYQFFCSVI